MSQTISFTILEKASRGDERAWRIVCDRLERRLRCYCKKRVSEADVDDVIQNILLSCWKSLHQFQPSTRDRSFTAWCLTIAKHEVANYFRSKTPAERGSGGTTAQRRISEVPQPLKETCQLSDLLSEVYRKIREHMESRFKPSTWRTFELREIHEMSIAQIAAELGLSQTAVTTSLSRIRSALRSSCGSWLEEDPDEV